MNEKFPELTKESGNDVCFKHEVICVILTSKEKPAQQNIDLFTELQNYLSPKIDRGGIKYKFGWLNTSTQGNFVKAIELETPEVPHTLIINPGKRKRFNVVEGGLNIVELKAAFDKLASGDVRFKQFKGNTIPDLE